tara:strand:- start:95 stop:541 length:447 start_codon:yes stop_codon:yes gene_type:complete
MDTTKCNVSTLQPGDFLSTTVYYTVTDIKDNGDVRVVDEDGKSLTISKDIVARESYSAQQFTEDKVANRTDMVKVLQNAGDTIFTVKFKKKDNSDRTLVGRRVPGSQDTCFGRTNALEMVPGQPPQKRQIDHRTISEITFKNKRLRIK